jgi:hypothetical protein
MKDVEYNWENPVFETFPEPTTIVLVGANTFCEVSLFPLRSAIWGKTLIRLVGQ